MAKFIVKGVRRMMTDDEVKLMKRVILERDPQTRKRLIDAEYRRIEVAQVVLVRDEHKLENVRARYEAQVRRQQDEEYRHRQEDEEYRHRQEDEERQRYATEQLRLKQKVDETKRPLTS
jgi:hypothetical protein